jgi:plasmid stabilization system protein ParE
MAEIIWSNLALDDLRSIHEYVSQDSPVYAEQLIDKIIERVDLLEKHARIGKWYLNLTQIASENWLKVITGLFTA